MTNPEQKLEAHISDYKQGFIDGLTAYAWWKGRQQVCGTSEKPLKQAISEIEKTWNYAEPRTRPVLEPLDKQTVRTDVKWLLDSFTPIGSQSSNDTIAINISEAICARFGVKRMTGKEIFSISNRIRRGVHDKKLYSWENLHPEQQDYWNKLSEAISDAQGGEKGEPRKGK